MKDNYILNALRSPNATLGVLVLALIAQLPHAADVFRLIVHGSDFLAKVHSYSFAIALELAVLLFVVQNRHKESYGFAVVSIAMNLSYYHLHDVQLIALAALPALLVSIALPVAIARYSHAVADAHSHTPVSNLNPQVQADIVQAHTKIDTEMALVGQLALQASLQDARDAQHGELILHDDSLLDLQERINALQSEGFDAKWIATHELCEIAGSQLASLLNVNASTISRWRAAAKRNGHNVEVSA